MSRYYPIYYSLAGKRCLVVGGGPVAERKTLGLLEAEARVRLVSLTWTPEIEALAAAERIEAIPARYEAKYLDGVVLAFAATNVREVNAQVASDASERGIPVNVADAPEEGDFIVPSVVRRGELCLSISTGGNQPMLAARLAAEMEARFSPEYEEFVELLGQMRDSLKETLPDASQRRKAMSALLEKETELRAYLKAGEREAAETLAKRIVEAG